MKKITKGVYIEAKINETFEISMDSNPSIPYRWHWVNRFSNSNVDSVGVEYQANYRGNEVLIGGGGIKTWYFVAKKEKLDSIVFDYKASFSDGHRIKRKVFYINVKT